MTVPETETQWPMSADLVVQMLKAGLLDGEKVELIDGRLLTVAPQGPEHWSQTRRLLRAFQQVYGATVVAEQAPLLGGAHSIPEADVAVLKPGFDDTKDQLPSGSDCVLVVEVTHSTHRRDRMKADIYASIGVPEYWMVDVKARRIEVHRGLVDGERYGTVSLLTGDESLTFPRSEHAQTVASLLGD